MTCTSVPRHIVVTHRGNSRWVRATGRVEQYCNSDKTIRHRLTQTSTSTTFLRQLELFSGRSISERGIENDRNIERLADGISSLEGISNHFDHIVAENFQNEGRELFVESIDFDKGLLCVMEIKKKTLSQHRTVEEMWEMVIQETAATGVSSNGNIGSIMDSLLDNNGNEIDYQNEKILKEMRKIVHRLGGIEELLTLLQGQLNERGADEIRQQLVENTLDLMRLNKMLLEILLEKNTATSGLYVKELHDILMLVDDVKDKYDMLDVLKRIVSLYNTDEIQNLRRWLLRNISFTLIVLLIDNSKSMVLGNMMKTSIEFCKAFLETMKKSSKLSAATVVTVADGPKCQIPFTLVEDFNINSLDNIPSYGCTPLTASLKFSKKILTNYLDLHRNLAVEEEGNSNALTGFIVMCSDMKPTEEWNGCFMEYVSNPKDESQESEQKNTKLTEEVEKTISTDLNNTPLVLVSSQLNTIGNRLGTRKNIHILNNSEMSGSCAILANYSLLQQYDKIKDTIRTSGRTQYKLQNLSSKEKVQENERLAEIFQQLDAEWIIKLKSEIISLSAKDNDILNHKAVRDMERFRTSSTVVSLTIKGEKRNCRIVPIKKDSSSSSAKNLEHEKGKLTYEEHKIKITFGEDVETHSLIKKVGTG